MTPGTPAVRFGVGRLLVAGHRSKRIQRAGRCQELDALRNEAVSRLIVSAAEADIMPDHQREIYHSENGDRWFLSRDDDGRAFILHKANLSSGGQVSSIELSDFLCAGKAGPAHQALIRLIGSLVESR
jgi:hypothetical protein